MADNFDPYRERLVMETQTGWASQCPKVDEATRLRVAILVHEDPAAASDIEYLRTHTGFCRQIIVTPDDLERLGIAAGAGQSSAGT